MGCLMKKSTCLTISIVTILCLTLHTATAFIHDQEGEKSIGNSAGAGIGGDGPWETGNMHLLTHMPLEDIGGGASNVLGNDCWGWTDSLDGKEYAIMGLTNATSFIDVSDPYDPKYLGKLPTQTGNKAWRDMKVCNDHVYVVSDGNGAHGMQIFDLKLLRNVDPANPQTFSNTAHYDGFDKAHNIVINETTGYAYIVGSEVASGGMRIFDLTDPLNPLHVADFSSDGYTHDAQVVIYHGPDTTYKNHEIAFNSNEDTLTIVDVSNKNNISQISRTGYIGSEYSHQGWVSEDQKYFFMDDELDEWRANDPIQTRTRVWDVTDLDNPVYLGYHNGTEQTIDHNLYVKGNYVYQANYSSGLRVLKIHDPSLLDLEEYGFFDSYNTDNNISFNGAWSCYPYFESGSLLISDRQNGLFIVATDHTEVPPLILEVTKGKALVGDVERLNVSDDKILRIFPHRFRFAIIDIAGLSPTLTPTEMTFTLEAHVTGAVGDYDQYVELYNYATSEWDLVDERLAQYNNELKTDIVITGVLSDYVDPVTGMLEARVEIQAAKFTRFLVVFDMAVWTIK